MTARRLAAGLALTATVILTAAAGPADATDPPTAACARDPQGLPVHCRCLYSVPQGLPVDDPADCPPAPVTTTTSTTAPPTPTTMPPAYRPATPAPPAAPVARTPGFTG